MRTSTDAAWPSKALPHLLQKLASASVRLCKQRMHCTRMVLTASSLACSLVVQLEPVELESLEPAGLMFEVLAIMG